MKRHCPPSLLVGGEGGARAPGSYTYVEKYMGTAINRSLISAHFSMSAYFLTPQTYKLIEMHYAWVAAPLTRDWS